MKAFIFFTAIVFSLSAQAQTDKDYNRIIKADDGLYFMYYDSSSAKSTLVEFSNFIALIELPISDKGGNATNLKDHTKGGEKALATLKKHFPNKPLKYLFTSHWHPHSISSINPFLSNGVSVVSTRANFEKINEFADPELVKKFKKKLLFVDKDSLVIKDKQNSIVAYHFKQSEFTNCPTPDYLYFYLPRYNSLNSGCMYSKTDVRVYDKELITGRAMDLNKFLVSKNIVPSYLIRLTKEKNESDERKSGVEFQSLVKSGLSSKQLMDDFIVLSAEHLRLKRDSLAAHIIANKIPISILNSAVYAELKSNQLNKALELAILQSLLKPDNANSWDTLGEVYFFLGNEALALYYEKQAIKLDSTLQGMSAWKQDLTDYSKLWK